MDGAQFDRHLSGTLAILVEHAGDAGLDTTRDGTRVTAVGAGPDEFNVALVRDVPADPAATMGWAHDLLASRGQPFMVQVPEPLAVHVDGSLQRLGMAVGFRAPGMARATTRDVPPPPAGLRIERVTDPAGLEANTLAAALGFGAPDASAMDGLFPPSLLDDDRVTFLSGFVDGADTPSAVAVSVVAEGVAGVYSVAVHASARRRGFGEAMTWAAMRDGARDGVDEVLLQATPLGRPVYERMGFAHVRTHLRYRATG